MHHNQSCDKVSLTWKCDVAIVRQNGIGSWNWCSSSDLNEEWLCSFWVSIKCNQRDWSKHVPFLYHAAQISFQTLNLNSTSPKNGWFRSNSGGLATINSNRNTMWVRSGKLPLYAAPRCKTNWRFSILNFPLLPRRSLKFTGFVTQIDANL